MSEQPTENQPDAKSNDEAEKAKLAVELEATRLGPITAAKKFSKVGTVGEVGSVYEV